MSLTNCIECGHEISSTAVACPNCGHPTSAAAPNIHRTRVVPMVESESFPKWVLIPIIILGSLLLLLMVSMLRNQNETSNVNVDITSKRPAESVTSDRPDYDEPRQSTSTTTTVPESSDRTVSQDVPLQNQTDVVPVPPEKPDKGTVKIEARVRTKTGETQAVKAEKFYLLDKDLETILSEADIKSINGNSLTQSFGLSVLYPERYRDLNEKALKALNEHIKYDTLTDASGLGVINSVKPDRYYLFGITKTRNGFAIWNSQITIQAGENELNLQPAGLTEVSE